MPTYDYRCLNDHVFEVFHGMSDETPRFCPECGAAAKRVPGGGAGLLFKGSGFYITDYRSSSYKEGAKSESTPKGGAKPESAPKPPPKPAGESGSSSASGKSD
jgi:putative FmdB family regulatory protein